MKLIIVAALAFVACACAEEPIKIVRSEFNHQPEGGYEFNYETANGIVRQETGEVKEALDEEKKPHQVVVVRGSYTYTDSEGKSETISYVADEFGYQPEGASIPKPASRR